LEIFFSYIRGMACANEHPSALEFKYRLRWYIFGKHSEAVFNQNKNTEGTLEPNLLKPLEGATTSDNVDDDMEHQVVLLA
jgi:hypothetical protein